MIWYLRVLWHHDFAQEPVEIFSEGGDDDYETRKVDVFRDGRLEWANTERETDTTSLGTVLIPPLSEINAQDEFAATVIEVGEFKATWQRALAGIHDQ
jgi:hypothetical protein